MYWIQCIENGPRRVNHAAVELDDLIYSFGGYSNREDYTRVTPIDIHIFNIHTYKWSQLPKPSIIDSQHSLAPFTRYGHTVVTYKRKFYLWGGRNDHPGACSRLFCFDPRSRQWSIVPTLNNLMPNPRDGHSACVIDDRMYIFGGFEDRTHEFSNQLFYFDFIKSSWHLHSSEVGNEAPQSRDFHTATSLNNQMYVFGGRFDYVTAEQTSETIYDNRLYMFNPVDSCWTLIPTEGQQPCGRRSHSAFVYNDKIYIFGGFNSIIKTHFNDLHEFNPMTSLWRCIKTLGIDSPVPRRRQCCLVNNHRLYMFGGTSPYSAPCVGNHLREIDHNDGSQVVLYDQNDLYVFDFAPTLKTLCFLYLAQRTVNINLLPKSLQQEYHLLLRQRSTGEASG